MWGEQTEKANPRYGQRKTHVPRTNFTNVIFNRNLMAKNSLELTLSSLKNQAQWTSRSLDGTRQAFILRQLVQQENLQQAGLGHVSLLPEEVTRSHRGLLGHRTNHHHYHQPPGGGGAKDPSPRGKEGHRRGQGPDHLLPAITAEQRLRAERRRCKNLKREMEALQDRQAKFFDSISDGFWVKPRLTVTPEAGLPRPSPPPAMPQPPVSHRLGAKKFMALPSIVTPKVFSEKDPPRDPGIFRNQMWRQEGSWN